MKFIFVALVGLMSSAAVACPDLSGHFACKDFEDGSVQDIIMTQKVENGATVYNMALTANGVTKNFEYIADGVARTTSSDRYTTRTEKNVCDGNKLVTDLEGVLKKDGTAVKVRMVTYITPEGHMYDNYIGTEGGKPVSFEEVCQRMH